jgi:hypothetical protein
MSEFAAAHALPPDGSTPLVKVFPAHKYLPPYRVDKTRAAYRKSCRVSAIDDAPEIAPIPIAAHRRHTHNTFYPTTWLRHSRPLNKEFQNDYDKKIL